MLVGDEQIKAHERQSVWLAGLGKAFRHFGDTLREVLVDTVIVAERQVRVQCAGQDVACHAQNACRRVSIIERSHPTGNVGAHGLGVNWLARPYAAVTSPPTPPEPVELLWTLAECETALGTTIRKRPRAGSCAPVRPASSRPLVLGLILQPQGVRPSQLLPQGWYQALQ